MDFYSPEKYVPSTWKLYSVLLLPVCSHYLGKLLGIFVEDLLWFRIKSEWSFLVLKPDCLTGLDNLNQIMVMLF